MKQLENGLWQGHFYTVSAVNSIDLEGETNQIQLVRLRNMVTNVGSDWKGPWGLRSREWEIIPDAEKEHYGLCLELDGEFWMTYDDFKVNFSKIDICNLERPNNGTSFVKYKWEMASYEDKWEPGISAGGCSTKGLPGFQTNPRFCFTVTDKDCDLEDNNLATVVIGLMQKNRSSKKSTGMYDLKIGVCVSKEKVVF